MTGDRIKKTRIPLDDSPIALPGLAVYLISTISQSGVRNIAPYGMVMLASYKPLMFTVGSDKDRDTYRNILETKEFVLNVPDTKMVEKVNIAGAKLAPDIDEFEKADLTPIDAFNIKPPLIAECKVHFECRLIEIYEITTSRVIILAEAIGISVDKDINLKNPAQQKDKMDPLYYIRGAYFGLGRYVGKR